jgi:integrase
LVLKGSGNGTGSWVYRKRIAGRLKTIGLGPFPNVGVDEARAKRDEIEKAIREGRSFESLVSGVGVPATMSGTMTFWQYADDWLKRNKPIPKSGKPRTNALWRKRIEDYCKLLHAIPLKEISVLHIRNALMPIWLDKIDSADRTRHHLGAIFAAAKVEGLVDSNPAAWADNLVHIMPKRRKKVCHHPSLPYQSAPEFYDWLEEQGTITARCIQWTMLTGVRPSEARGAEWPEFDFEQMVWRVPESRMKETGLTTDHTVPISSEMLRVLAELRKGNVQYKQWGRSWRGEPAWWNERRDLRGYRWLFRLDQKHRPLSETSLRKLLAKAPFEHCTMHGWRSTVTMWFEEVLHVPTHIADAVLAHKKRDQTMRAYNRSDHLEQRRPLMEQWGQYLAPGWAERHHLFGPVNMLTDDMFNEPKANPVGRPKKIHAQVSEREPEGAL